MIRGALDSFAAAGGGEEESSSGGHSSPPPLPPPPSGSRYESQKRRDWNMFGQFLKYQIKPPVKLSQCNSSHVLDFLRYLDQFGKTKVHLQDCIFYRQPPHAFCSCPLRQSWSSLDALIGRLRVAFEENCGPPENNPFASGAIRRYLWEVHEDQTEARWIPSKTGLSRWIESKKVTNTISEISIQMPDKEEEEEEEEGEEVESDDIFCQEEGEEEECDHNFSQLQQQLGKNICDHNDL